MRLFPDNEVTQGIKPAKSLPLEGKVPAKQADEVALEVSANDSFMPIFDAKKPDFSGMLISAVHNEGEEENLHLLLVDPSIPAGAKLY